VCIRRDGDAAAVAEVELDVLTRFLDVILPWTNDGVPVDPYDGHTDDDDTENDAELGWRVEAVPGVVGVVAPWAVASCFKLGKHVGLLDQ
jgi:hypothetical protein